jgi:hypothetical protein
VVAIPAKVAILGGDPIIGGSLEALLQAAGYRARFLSETGVDRIDELLADSQLVIFAPLASPKLERALLERMSRQPGLEIPVLELVPLNGEHSVREHALPWPCSLEMLKRTIDSVLLTRG